MDFVRAIVENSEKIATLADRTDLAIAIPSCPQWTAGDLVFHLASVHRFWAAAVSERNPEARPHIDDGDVDDSELVSWARQQTVSLVNALSVAVGAPCWTWWGEPRNTVAVARHQAQEATLHCWDMCNALGQDFEIPFDQAVDGISEFLEVMSSSMEMPSGHHLAFQPDDCVEVMTYGDLSLPPVKISGSASAIVLVMYKRWPIETLTVDGDVSIVQRWLDALDLS